MTKPKLTGFMAQFAKARREVAALRRRYPHACCWATLTFPTTRAALASSARAGQETKS